MTLEELHSILASAGYPTAYLAFKTPQAPPYICYLAAYSHNVGADNVVWKQVNHIQIELYTENKDRQAERKIEEALMKAGIYYETTDTYIDSEKLYQRIYEIEV